MKRLLIGIRALGLALGWTVLSALFGLMHLILVVASTKLIVGSPPIGVGILLDGVLLFFATALVAALTIDYFFSKDQDYPKPVAGLLFCLYPALIIGVSIWLFGLCFGKTPQEVCVETLKNGTVAVVIMSLIYATVVKSLAFIQK